MADCILVCAGDFTLCKIPRTEEDLLIAVDAGLTYCDVLQMVPDVILGDFDSLDESEQERVAALSRECAEKVITLPKEKDDTDTMAALRYGLEKGYRSFRIYGAVGGRMDHYLANLQVLLYLKHHGASGMLLDGTQMVLAIENEEIVLPKDLEGVLSLFSMVERSEGVTISGMKYNVENITITNDYPIGQSNELIGEEATISVKNGSLVAIISFYQDE